MFPPALMIKITEPSSELYEFKAISDEELRFANNKFIKEDLPYRVRVQETSVCATSECGLTRLDGVKYPYSYGVRY